MKFALVIGAVFLAVLIVYISVMQPDKGRTDVSLVGTDGKTIASPDAQPVAPAPAPQPPAPSIARPHPASPAITPPVADKPKSVAAKIDAADHATESASAPPVRSQLTPGPSAAPVGDPAADPWHSALTFGMLDTVKPAVDLQPDTSTPSLDVPLIQTDTPGPEMPTQAQIPTMADITPPAPVASPTPDSAAPTRTALAPVPTTHPVLANTGARTHVVATGETFSSIAQTVYGASKYWNRIADANPNVQPKSLRPGMILIIPAFSAPVEPAAPAAVAPAPLNPKTEYRVQAGDSLYKIAVHLFNNGQYAEKIYDLNKPIIGPDPAKLKVGMVLNLPLLLPTGPSAAAAPAPAIPR